MIYAHDEKQCSGLGLRNKLFSCVCLERKCFRFATINMLFFFWHSFVSRSWVINELQSYFISIISQRKLKREINVLALRLCNSSAAVTTCVDADPQSKYTQSWVFYSILLKSEMSIMDCKTSQFEVEGWLMFVRVCVLRLNREWLCTN